MIHIEHLPWDSGFFKRSIGRAHISSELDADALAELKSAGHDTIYLFSEIPQPFLEAHHIPLADEKLTFVKNLSPQVDTSTGIQPLPKSPTRQSEKDLEVPVHFTPSGKTPALDNLFLSSGHQSRYKTDPVFRPFFEAFYNQWLTNALNGTFADHFLATGTPADPSGIIVLKQMDMAMHISIIAVSPAHQKKGIGRQLINLAEQKATQKNLTTLSVDTQSTNTPAVAFYERMGFEVQRRVFIYHWHAE